MTPPDARELPMTAQVLNYARPRRRRRRRPKPVLAALVGTLVLAGPAAALSWSLVGIRACSVVWGIVMPLIAMALAVSAAGREGLPPRARRKLVKANRCIGAFMAGVFIVTCVLAFRKPIPSLLQMLMLAFIVYALGELPVAIAVGPWGWARWRRVRRRLRRMRGIHQDPP